MKKRLLSAVLALAMVLTLLPVSVFAAYAEAANSGKISVTYAEAANSGKISVTYYDTATTASGNDEGHGIGWFYKYTDSGDGNKVKYKSVTTGVINSTGNSGTWYNTLSAALQAGATQVRLIDNQILSWTDAKSSLTINLDNGTSGSTVTLNNNWSADMALTTLTIQGVVRNGVVQGQISNDLTTYKNGASITYKDVNFGSVYCQEFSNSAKVVLDNAHSTYTGIGLTGKPAANSTTSSGGQVEVKNGSEVENITITHANGNGGTVSVTGGSKVTGKIEVSQTSGGSSTAPTVSVTGDSSVTGNITVTQTTGGYINVVSSSMYASKVTGNVELTSANGGTINYTNAQVTGATSLKGYGTKLINEGSSIGAVNVYGTADANAAKQTAPEISINGEYAKTGAITAGEASLNGNTADTLINAYTLKITNNATVASTVLRNANVTVNGAEVTGSFVLQNGRLDVTSSANLPASISANASAKVTLGANNSEPTNLYVTLSDNSTRARFGEIEEYSANTNNIILSIPSDSTNYFLKLSPKASDSKVQEKVIKGGTWGNLPEDKYLVSDIQYVATRNSGVNGGHTFYTRTAIDNLIKDNENEKFDSVKVKGTATSPSAAIHFTVDPTYTAANDWDNTQKVIKNGKGFLTIYYSQETAFTLPSMVGGKTINIWSGTFYPDGGTASDVDTRGTGGLIALTTAGHYVFAGDRSDYTISQITNVKVNAAGPNATVTPALVNPSSNPATIKLSGSYDMMASGTFAKIPLVLSTDAEDGADIMVDVIYVPGGTANFQNLNGPKGAATITEQGKSLTLHNGRKYILDVTGLHEPVGLKFAGDGRTGSNPQNAETVTTVTDTSVGTEAARKALAETMSQPGAVDFSKSPAVLQAFGAATNNITATQVANWRKTAQTEAYRKDHNNQNPSGNAQQIENLLTQTGYYDVYAVLYMAVNVTRYGSGNNNTDALTATLTPSWRIEVRHATKDPIVISGVGGSLGKIGDGVAVVGDGTATGVKITLPVRTGFVVPANGMYVNQDGNYVYEVKPVAKESGWTSTLNDVAAQCPQFTITHTGSSTGLGTITIGTVAPTVTLYETTAKAKMLGTYSNVQKALDDSKNGNYIEVKAGYGPATVSMTGKARTVTVKMLGNDKLTAGASGRVTQSPGDGTLYTVQLDKDNIVKPTEKPIPITVASAVGGSASLSASRADEGDTITVTLVPATGYTAGGITVRTDTGANVSYTATGTNTYRFVVPTGAKSITVTPSFTRTNTGVLVTVASTTYGTATTTAGTNRVAVGSTVSVTVSPRSGYRTMGLYATSDTGVSATAYRTGVNTFTFTVPSATSSVVVTPRFDVNNGTVFEDVWSTEYYSAPVAWAVGRGITDGTDTYHFSPGQSCNRVQMVTFMWRAAGRPSTAGMANPFYDVSPSMGNDFYNAILWANAKGITNGDGSTTRFNPYKTVTRAEAVTFLWRYEGKPAASTNSGFYDVPAREWYAQAVTWAVGKGITNGDGSTVRFNPNGACLRAQIVTFLYRDITGARA